jgi:hypothetical protein
MVDRPSYDEPADKASAIDAFVSAVGHAFLREPVAMGVVTGVIAGALSGSGVVFFAATVVAWGVAGHFRRSRDARSS